MSRRLHDARIRGWVALGVASVFFGVPALVVFAVVGGLFKSEDLKQILEPWALYMGPLTGAVFGYYFGSSEDRKNRPDDQNDQS